MDILPSTPCHARQASLLLQIFIVSSLGCACASIKREPLDKEHEATIRVEGPAIIGISDVDGVEPPGILKPKFLVQSELAPGRHTLTAVYFKDYPLVEGRYSRYKFALDVKDGHHYLIQTDAPQVTGWSILLGTGPQFARVWIRDSKSGAEVGEVLESDGEPVYRETKLELADYFHWPFSPDARRDVKLSRRRGGMTVKWRGKGPGESYFATIRIHALPPIASQDEFTDYVRHVEVSSAAASNGGRNFNASAEAVSGRQDYCVRYHRSLVTVYSSESTSSSSLDHPLKSALLMPLLDYMTEPNALVESYGYDCRIPSRKNFGINFELSHQSINQNPDPMLMKEFDDCFADLKF